jgi:uncharacterized protein YkwD
MHDDAFYAVRRPCQNFTLRSRELTSARTHQIPQNASTIVDLLEAKNVSWASYQENMPYDGFT